MLSFSFETLIWCKTTSERETYQNLQVWCWCHRCCPYPSSPMYLYLLGQATDCWSQEQESERRDCWLKTHLLLQRQTENNIKWISTDISDMPHFRWYETSDRKNPANSTSKPLKLHSVNIKLIFDTMYEFRLGEKSPFSPTLVILLRREVSIGRFLEMGTVFQPSSWGGPPRPGVWGPPRPPIPPPPILPPGPPPDSFLETRACCTFICSLCSSNSASLWIWSMVLGPWSPRRGTQLF